MGEIYLSPVAILAAAAFVLAPGLGLVLALLPSAGTRLSTQFALVVPFGFGFIGLLGLVLTLLHVMIPSVFLPLYAAGVAAAWWAALRREALGSRARAWRAGFASGGWPSLLAAIVLLALVAVRLGYSPLFNLGDQTPLRYWADGIEIADAGRIPEVSLHWGRLIEPTVSKVVLNAFHAGTSFVLGRGPLEPMGALLLVVSVALMAAAFALGRELGLTRSAILLPVLLFANVLWGEGELTTDLITYRAENWGRLLALAGMLLAVRALRGPPARPGRTDAVLAGILLGVAAGTHLVPFAVGSAFVGAHGLARLGLPPRSWRVVRPLATIGALAVVIGTAVLLIPRGDVGFQGASGADAYRELREEVGDPTFDPTLYIATGETRVDAESQAVLSPREILSYFTATAAGVPRLPGARWILPLALLGILLAVARWGGKDLLAAAVAAALFALFLVGASVLFAARYEVFALSQFGPRRLFDYATIPTVLVGLAVVEVGLGALRRRSLGLAGRRIEASGAAAAVLIVAAVAVLLPTSLAPRERLPLLRSAVRSLAWIRSNVPCEGRVLADRRTLATFEMMTRRAGVLEGMGPHLRPRVLARAVGELLEAERFFEDPVRGEAYLEERGVAAVIVTAPDAPLGGTHRVAEPDLSGLERAVFLRPAARTPAARVYRVAGFEPTRARDLPDVRRLAGYGCASGGG